MTTLWIWVEGGWWREPQSNLQAAKLAAKIIRAEGFICFVVLG
jgi:hypothetical protein